MLAISKIGTIAIAVKQPGVEVPELQVVDVSTKLNDTDLHFGIAFPEDKGASRTAFFNFFSSSLPKGTDVEDLKGGPRKLDVIKRGGLLAEDWESHVGSNTFLQAAVNKPAMAGKQLPHGAQISGVAVGGVKKYASWATVKQDLADDNRTVAETQQFTIMSKAALDFALASGRIHFHLEGMGDLSQIFSKTGQFSHNVTSRELRYVNRNWARFKSNVTFYNGYTSSGAAVIVEPPWLIWQDDSSTNNCTNCHAEFGVFTRKHHCRKCGKIFCDDCTTKRATIYNPGNGEFPIRRPNGKNLRTGEVRVCKACATVLGV